MKHIYTTISLYFMFAVIVFLQIVTPAQQKSLAEAKLVVDSFSPQKDSSTDEILNYGYGHKVLFISEIFIPNDSPRKEISISTKLTSLICISKQSSTPYGCSVKY
ncbi:MAG TPA: hypothetical protein VF870_09920 [Ignavibacteriaceae bacterium]